MNISYWNNLTLEQRQKLKSYLYKIEKQKQIIEKAIEYIENDTFRCKNQEEQLNYDYDLLNILRGKDNE